MVLPIWAVSSFLVLGACLFAVGVLLFRMGVVRGKLWRAVLVFPAFWASVEFAIAMLSVHGTFFNISYSQMNFLPILQIASVTGIWGISSRFVCLPPRLLRCWRRSSHAKASAPDRQCRFYCGCIRLWCVAARVDARFADH